MNSLLQNFTDLPKLLSGHVLLSICAIASASVVALSAALLASQRSRLQNWILSIAGVLQTVPSLALLALMVPVLGGAIGFAPAFVAMTVYALLPLLQNTVTGLAATQPQLVEAARGLGMTDRQILFRIRFPLALPVIVAGLRTSTVWTVGTATLATAVGASGLGSYIFTGLQTRNHAMTLFGCLFAALLAVVLDQALRLVETAVKQRRHRRAAAIGTVLAVALTAAVGGAFWPTFTQPVGGRMAEDQNVTAGGVPQPGPLSGRGYITGSKSFVESHLLAELIGLSLEEAGAEVVNRPSMGSTILFDALRGNSVDVYVDYTGTIWATLMRRTEPASRLRTRIEVTNFLYQEHGVLSVGPLGFKNDYAFAMNEVRAGELGIRSIPDLSGRNLEIGGDPEVFGRPEWERVRSVYGLDSLVTRPMQAIYMFDAVRNGQVDVITAYTTDGRLAEGGLVLLDDPQQALPPYDAVLLVSPDASKDAALLGALSGLVNRIDDQMMATANLRVEAGGDSPRQAALWLRDRIRRQLPLDRVEGTPAEEARPAAAPE